MELKSPRLADVVCDVAKRGAEVGEKSSRCSQPF